MKLHDASIIIIISIIVLCAGYKIVKEIKPDIIEDDNLAEEILEDVLEDKTGISIDLTPYSLEEKKRLEEDERILKEFDRLTTPYG